jgi:two-component system sensor histidine kinase BaeS
MQIQTKLFAIFLLSSVFLTGSLIFFIQWNINNGMIEYINDREVEALTPFTQTLARQYQQTGDWGTLQGKHRLFMDMLMSSLQNTEFGGRPDDSRRPMDATMPPPPHHRGKPPGHSGKETKFPRRPGPGQAGPQRSMPYVLLNANKQPLIGEYPSKQDYSLLPITDSELVVGYLGVSKRNQLTRGYDLNFVEQQKSKIWLVALGLLMVTLLVALPLSQHLIRPIRQLASGMSNLTNGRYEHRLTLARQDEFNQLERDFNELALTLSKNENARKRWLADVSHELRTPVAILKGEMEAILDGVRPLSIGQIKSSSEEVYQLEKLIEDLHELTRSDLGTQHYQKTELDIKVLIEEEARKYTYQLQEKGMQLSVMLTVTPLMVFADKKRVKQLIGNLMTNILHYAQGADSVCVSVERHEDKLILKIEDNGIGVKEGQLEQVFEHLYRAENSRNRTTGGSGLGLAICKQIVIAHHGSIVAEHAELGGLAIIITLPLA